MNETTVVMMFGCLNEWKNECMHVCINCGDAQESRYVHNSLPLCVCLRTVLRKRNFGKNQGRVNSSLASTGCPKPDTQHRNGRRRNKPSGLPAPSATEWALSASKTVGGRWSGPPALSANHWALSASRAVDLLSHTPQC